MGEPQGKFCRRAWIATILLLLCGHSRFGLAQGTPASSPAEVLKAFEPAADQEYELGRGDEISVDVFSRPELSAKHVIGPDGRITVLPAGDVLIAGKTRAQAGAIILEALSSFYKDLTVTVSVDRYTSNHVLLLGAVDRPGIVTFEGTPTLLEVLSRGSGGSSSYQDGASLAGSGLPGFSLAGQTTAGASEMQSVIAVPEVCMVYRGNQSMVTVRLHDLLKNGNPEANMRLKRDDIVFVPGEKPYVSILGSVLRPGLEGLESTSTLQRLLAAAGGLTDKAGEHPKIFIVHPAVGNSAGGIETVSFRDVLEARPLHFTLRSGDMIYVPESGFNHVADVVQKASPLISLVTVGALLR